MITFHTECWADYFKGCQKLWKEHYDEIAVQKDKMPMNPDIAAYATLEASGMLNILTMRDGGKMVGYHISIVRNHFHYADVLCGIVDAYFVSASHRKGLAGVLMFKEAEARLKARGVKKLFTGTKNSKDMSRIFEYLGWTPTEQLFSKYIGN